MTKKMNDEEIDEMVDPEADAFFEELKQHYREHRARIDAIFENAEFRINWDALYAARRRLRLRQLWWALIGAVCAAVAVAALLLLPRREGCDALLMGAGLLLAAVAATVAVMAALQCRRIGRPPTWPLSQRPPRMAPLGAEHCGTSFGVAAVVLLVVLMQAPMGDGYMIAAGTMGRDVAVANVNMMMEKDWA